MTFEEYLKETFKQMDIDSEAFFQRLGNYNSLFRRMKPTRVEYDDVVFWRNCMSRAEFNRQYTCEPSVEECTYDTVTTFVTADGEVRTHHKYRGKAFESGMDPGKVGEDFTVFTYKGIPVYKSDNLRPDNPEEESRSNVVDAKSWQVIEDEGTVTALALRGKK